VCLEALDYKSK